MNQPLEYHLPTKSRLSRKYILLFCILGLSSSLYTFVTAQPEDPELWCINWRTVFKQASIFAKFASFVILGYFKNYYRKYGPMRICLYLVFVTFISYVTVAHGLDQASMMLWKWFEGNVIRRLDDSVIVIDENRNETTSMRRLEEKPFFIEEHFRYNNEDVKFRCYDTMTFSSEVGPSERQVIWKHNNNVVVPSWKFHIEFSFIEINAGKSDAGEQNENTVTNDKTNQKNFTSDLYTYVIDSTLTIYQVEDPDYGNYSCHLRESARIKNKISQTNNTKQTSKQKQKPKPSKYFFNGIPICVCIGLEEIVEQFQNLLSDFYEKIQLLLQKQMLENQVLQLNTYQWTGEFKMTKIKKTTLTVSAPPGGIVSITASYLNLAEREDISLGYFINNKGFHEVCSGHFSGCSLFVLGYWMLWDARGFFGILPEVWMYWLNMRSSILGISWQCVCPSTYGINVFRFYRHFYNITSGKSMIFEVEHPRSVKLIPRDADVLFAFQNETKPETLAGKMGEECLDSVPFINSCSWMERIINKLDSDYFLIEKLLFILAVVVSFMITFVFWKLLISLIVACRNIIYEGPLVPYIQKQETEETLGGIGHSGLSFTHDVYVSYVDSQLDIASDLVSKLESFGKTVYFRDRDITIGDMKLEAVADAIVSSRMFLILVSQEYIDSGFQNSYEFQQIQIQIHKNIVPETNIVLLKHGDCRISDYFYFSGMQLTDMNSTYADDLTRKLKLWSNCGKEEKSDRMSIFLLCFITASLGMGLIIPKPFTIAEQLIKTILSMWIKL